MLYALLAALARYCYCIASSSSYHNNHTTTNHNKHTSAHHTAQPVYPQQYLNHPQKFKAKGKTFSTKLIKDRGVA